MKRLRVLIALFAVVGLSPVLAADSADRPAGVEARNWLPISEGFGFVVVAEQDARIVPGSRQVLIADPEHVSADLMPPKKGYFVIKTKAGWQRLVISDLPDIAD